MSLSDEDTRAGRTRRYAKVGGAVGGTAARFLAARWLGFDLDTAKHAGDLTEALGGLKGPLMKVAQLLATIPDALPEEYVQELRTLQSSAPAMGWPFVRRRMASELGPDWRERFADFERKAAHAASLGQVHRARSLDGQDFACKLQYPDMRSAVEADLRQLALAFRVFEGIDKQAIETSEIQLEIQARLREELDYTLEARRMALFTEMLKGEAGVCVPAAVSELSTGRLLTMEWLEGRPLLELKDAPMETRNAVAHNMFRAWYVPFYRYGVIHGDPHLGNYTVRSDNAVNLLDFGCVRVFPPHFVRGVTDLYRAVRDDDHDLAAHAYETWGFSNLSREVIEVLNLWAEYLYAPLIEDKVQRIQPEGESGVYGARVASKVHSELRRLGGVRPPREFVFMDRAAVGLGSVFMHLRAEINWHKLFHSLVDGFDEAALAKRRVALTGEAAEAVDR